MVALHRISHVEVRPGVRHGAIGGAIAGMVMAMIEMGVVRGGWHGVLDATADDCLGAAGDDAA